MRQKYAHILVVRLRLKYSMLLLALLLAPYVARAADAESFFDDELPEEKKNSDDLKSKPIEINEEQEKKNARKITNEKGEILQQKEKVIEKPRADGPTEQVAPMGTRSKETILDNSRFSLAGDYFLNTGRGTATLPAGWGAFLAYDADESHGKGFDLRFEVGYLNLTKSDSSIAGFYFEGGPTWIYRIPKLPIQFLTAILPGLGYYNFQNSQGQGSGLKATAHVALGIEFPMLMKRADRTDEFVPFLQLRGGVIYDDVLPVISYGVYAGMAYKFGQVIFKY